jgi:hypothetical protein
MYTTRKECLTTSSFVFQTNKKLHAFKNTEPHQLEETVPAHYAFIRHSNKFWQPVRP